MTNFNPVPIYIINAIILVECRQMERIQQFVISLFADIMIYFCARKTAIALNGHHVIDFAFPIASQNFHATDANFWRSRHNVASFDRNFCVGLSIREAVYKKLTFNFKRHNLYPFRQSVYSRFCTGNPFYVYNQTRNHIHSMRCYKSRTGFSR